MVSKIDETGAPLSTKLSLLDLFSKDAPDQLWPPSYWQLYWHANADWQKLRCGDLLDIGAVGVSKPVFALNNAGHCGELSLAPTSILEHD